MPAQLRHFAINADDVTRARHFYEAVFGWSFNPWGPPDFFQVADSAAGPGVIGALQGRRALVEGQRTNALEASFQVDDIRATLKAVEANGGKILMPPFLIEGVGEVGYFQDSEGNTVGVAQYLPGVWK